MEISDQLHCLFSARVEQRGESYYVEIPDRELREGTIQVGDTYRVGMFPSPTQPTDDHTRASSDSRRSSSKQRHPEPPVEEGEQRTVEIENLGDQGDGITRVERGFVVIIPDTDRGERVTIEITDVRENVAFAEVVKRFDYYE